MALEGIGPVIAESVVSQFADPTFQRCGSAGGAGIKPKSRWKRPVGDALEGEVVVVSGVFTTMSRDEAKSAVTAHGGRLVGSISSKRPWSGRGQHGAQQVGEGRKARVPIVDEDAFLARIQS